MGKLKIELENINAQLTYRAIKARENGCSVKLAINVGEYSYAGTTPQSRCREYIEKLSQELPQGYKLDIWHKSKVESEYMEEKNVNEIKEYRLPYLMEDVYAVASIDKKDAEKLYREAERFAVRILDRHGELVKSIYTTFAEEKRLSVAEEGICIKDRILPFRNLGVIDLEAPVQRYGMAIALASLFTRMNKKQYRADTDYTSAMVLFSNELLEW